MSGSRRDDVLAAAHGIVGECAVVGDHSWEIGLATVLELACAEGRVIAKGHRERRHFDVEVGAFRRWVPAIADRAPRLLGVDDARAVVVMSCLEGEHASTAFTTAAEEQAIHRDAGAVLHRFHRAEPGTADPEWIDRREAVLRRWIDDAPEGLLDAADVEWALSRLPLLRDALPAPTMVPCHGDWQPRNWYVANGRVSAFDFERAGMDWWTKDFQRMWEQEWIDRPDLRDAFFDGYGRTPTDDEVAALELNIGAGSIVQLVWATIHGDAPFADDARRRLARHRAAG